MEIDLSPVDLPEFAAGSVWLVGSGPGAPGLLSLLALWALKQADDIVYDALVGKGILALARPGSRLHYAGKRGGKPSAQQPDISNRLIELARQGKRVLRLKGGDPFVFGRGGEEALALEAARIPYRVVPGITAGVAALAQAGIPLTHRDTNSAVSFVTAYASGGGLPEDVDWDSLAKGSRLLVIYMALQNLDKIARRLMAAGKPRDEPVVIVSQATLPGQRVVETNLENAAADAKRAGITAPAVAAVGRTVRLKRAGL